MNRAIWIGLIAVAVLGTCGPTVVALAHALIPLVLVVGIVLCALRLIWHHTSGRW